MSLIPADTIGGDVVYYHAAFTYQLPAAVERGGLPAVQGADARALSEAGAG